MPPCSGRRFVASFRRPIFNTAHQFETRHCQSCQINCATPHPARTHLKKSQLSKNCGHQPRIQPLRRSCLLHRLWLLLRSREISITILGLLQQGTTWQKVGEKWRTERSAHWRRWTTLTFARAVLQESCWRSIDGIRIRRISIQICKYIIMYIQKYIYIYKTKCI